MLKKFIIFSGVVVLPSLINANTCPPNTDPFDCLSFQGFPVEGSFQRQGLVNTLYNNSEWKSSEAKKIVSISDRQMIARNIIAIKNDYERREKAIINSKHKFEKDFDTYKHLENTGFDFASKASSPVVSIIGTLAGSVAKIVLDRQKSDQLKKYDEKIKLVRDEKNYIANEGVKHYYNTTREEQPDFTGMTSEELDAEAKKINKFVFKESQELIDGLGIDPTAQAIRAENLLMHQTQQSYLSNIAKEVKKNNQALVENLEQAKANGETIAINTALTKSAIELGSKHYQEFKEFSNKQFDELAKINEEQAAIKSDTDFIKGQKILEMSSEELQAALQSGRISFQDLEKSGLVAPGADESKFIEKLSFKNNIKQTSSQLDQTSQAFQSIANFGAAIGMPAKQVEVLNKTSSVLGSAAQITMGIASGNPLAILNGSTGIIGVFGPKAPDVEAMRHEALLQQHAQTQKMIAGLSEQMQSNFEVLQENIDTQFENLNTKIDENFQKVYQQMADLNNKLSDIYNGLNEKLDVVIQNQMNIVKNIHTLRMEMHSRLDRIEQLQYYGLQSLTNYRSSNRDKNCHSFLHISHNNNSWEILSNDFQAFRVEFNDARNQEFINCRNEVVTLFTPGNGVPRKVLDQHFYIIEHLGDLTSDDMIASGEITNSLDFISEQQRRIDWLRFYKNSEVETIEAMMSLAFLHSKDLDELNFKLEKSNDLGAMSTKELFPSNSNVSLSTLLKSENTISPSNLIHEVETALQLLPFIELSALNPESRKMSHLLPYPMRDNGCRA